MECCEHTGQRLKCESGEQSFVRIPQRPLAGLEKEIPLRILPGGTVTVCSVLLCFMVFLEKKIAVIEVLKDKVNYDSSRSIPEIMSKM